MATSRRHLHLVDIALHGSPEPERRWSAGRRSGAALLVTAAALALVVGSGQLMSRTPSNDPGAVSAEQEIAATTGLSAITLAEGPDGPDIELSYELSTGEGTLTAEGLDPLPTDEAYALWFIDEDGLIPAGLFQPEHLNQPIELEVSGLDARIIAVAITIEPSSGNDEPTGDILFTSDVA